MSPARIAAFILALGVAPVNAAGVDVWWSGDHEAGTIVIETEQRRLTLVTEYGEGISWPIAVGRDGRTFFGETVVTRKAVDPTWYPTERMRAENPKLPAAVPAGPANPFGTRALYLEEGLLRIHGTNDPSSIGKAVSAGCFRMHNDDVEELYPMVGAGTTVVVLP